MLTTMFYYSHYKPYLLNVAEKGKAEVTKKSKIASPASQTESFKVLLNKTLNSDVVAYTRGVSGSMVGTKETSKNLVRDMTDFNKNIYRRGYDAAKRWIEQDVEGFTDAYNASTRFLSSQNHSQSLVGFSERLSDNIHYNIERLQSLGVSVGEDGVMVFDKEKYNSLSESEMYSAIGENVNLFQEIYNDASSIMSEPLKEHMQFKGLGYYYNYKLGRMENDTFKMIESGMLIDKVV